VSDECDGRWGGSLRCEDELAYSVFEKCALKIEIVNAFDFLR